MDETRRMALELAQRVGGTDEDVLARAAAYEKYLAGTKILRPRSAPRGKMTEHLLTFMTKEWQTNREVANQAGCVATGARKILKAEVRAGRLEQRVLPGTETLANPTAQYRLKQ